MSIKEVAALNPNLDAAAIAEEIGLVRDACKQFDLTTFREGHLTPVFFGSALKNFGVGDLLDAIGRMAPPPRAQKADKRTVEADEQSMSAFVFKIQANMDPNHRDRIAFARLCSGKLTRGMKVKQVRTGKSITLNAPQFFFAQDRAVADEAYAGDVVGIPNHGAIAIGDTLTEGEESNFIGVPSFAPEILRRVRLPDAMKAKKLKEALQQLAEEGVVQVFRPQDGSPALVGVVGPLQLDVLRVRLQGRIRPRSVVGHGRVRAGALDRRRRSQGAGEVHQPTTARASPTISTAIRSISRATSSISTTPASARRASSSPTSRTATPMAMAGSTPSLAASRPLCSDRLHRFYSITSSARASSVGGTMMPSALAVLRLIAISSLVGCSTGRSAGLAPLNILST